MLISFLSLCFVVFGQETKAPISIPYRIQGTVIFPNGTSVYADHELPSDPGRSAEQLLFKGLFQLAGPIPMGPVTIGESQDPGVIRGSVLFPDGRRIRAHRKILPAGTISEEHDEHYLRNGTLGAHVFTISDHGKGKTSNGGLPPKFPVKRAFSEQVKVNLEAGNSRVGTHNSYYLEKERLGAFVYSEGEQEPRLASTQTSVAESCRFSFYTRQGQRGQYWLLRSKPCGDLPRLTTTLPDGTNIHFYGVPVLVDL